MNQEVFSSFDELLKSHVKGYTRSDGTYVEEHDDKRQAAQPKPASVTHSQHSWGRLTKVGDGSSHVMLHPEHQEEVGDMLNGQSLMIRDEQGKDWDVARRGDSVHFKERGAGGGHFSAPHKDIAPAGYAKNDSADTPKIGEHADALAASSKKGELDHEDNQWAAKLMKKDDHEALRGHLRGLDTGARDHILDHIHPDHWESLGFKPFDKQKMIAEHEKRFGGSKAGGSSPVEPVAHSKGYKPGSAVMFPHPDKPGKKALGTYLGQRNGKSVISHKDKGEVEVEHSDVSGARGVPKAADPKATKEAGEYVRQQMAKNRDGGMAKAILLFGDAAELQGLAKSHVKGYTRSDGTFVAEHDDKRASSGPYAAAKKDVLSSVDKARHPAVHKMMAEMEAGGDEAEAFSKYHFGGSHEVVRAKLRKHGIAV